MNRIQTATVVALLSLPVPAIAQPLDEPDVFTKMGAYVASDDLGRSLAFYEVLFDRAPAIKLDNFIAFDVAGGWFAIVSRARYAPNAAPGSGATPYIQAADLDLIRERATVALGRQAPDILVEPGIHLLKLEDPNGQLVEFFSLTGL